jgi:hypothetical protein
MPSLFLGRLFLPFGLLVDVFLMVAALHCGGIMRLMTCGHSASFSLCSCMPLVRVPRSRHIGQLSPQNQAGGELATRPGLTLVRDLQTPTQENDVGDSEYNCSDPPHGLPLHQELPPWYSVWQ